VEIKNNKEKLRDEHIADGNSIMLDYALVPRKLMEQLLNVKNYNASKYWI
jgi:hypothetical protein